MILSDRILKSSGLSRCFLIFAPEVQLDYDNDFLFDIHWVLWQRRAKRRFYRQE
jgi:hypothetical protein